MEWSLRIDPEIESGAKVAPEFWPRICRSEHVLAALGELSETQGIILEFKHEPEENQATLHVWLSEPRFLLSVQPTLSALAKIVGRDSAPTAVAICAGDNGSVKIDAMPVGLADQHDLASARELRVFGSFFSAMNWLADVDPRDIE